MNKVLCKSTTSFVVSFIFLLQLTTVFACLLGVRRVIVLARLRLLKAQKLPGIYSKASVIATLILINFVVCWIPFFLIDLTDGNIFQRVTMDLFLLKSAVNPFLYIYAVRSIRHNLKIFLMCQCRKTENSAKTYHLRKRKRILKDSTYSYCNSAKSVTIVVEKNL